MYKLKIQKRKEGTREERDAQNDTRMMVQIYYTYTTLLIL